MTHHLHNTQTLENQKGKVLYYVYITKHHKIIQHTEIFFRILKRAVILISKNLGKFVERQRILKHAFQKDDQRNKKTKKIKLTLKT